MLADVMARVLLAPAALTIASEQAENKNIWDFQ